MGLVALLALVWPRCGNDAVAQVSVHLDPAPDSGIVVLELFDSANAFGDFRNPVSTVRFPADGRSTYSLEKVPPGTYALLVYHDRNNNGRIDKNFIGIPREALAFSNGYRPKGPPSYSQAAFVVDSDTPVHFDLELFKPLGERGRIGAGIGIIGRSSPYRGYDGAISQIIPALFYNGTRLQFRGPEAALGLVGSGKLRLAAMGRYRIGAYEEDNSDFLTGMGDAESTFIAGLALQSEWRGGIDVSIDYLHDVIDRIGGGEAHLQFSKSYQIGRARLSPQVGMNWLSPDLAENDFGVLSEQALPDRPAYSPGSTLSYEMGLGLFIELSEDWVVVLNTGVEILDKKIRRSPIVSEEHVFKGFAAVSYLF
jgi:outer membrane protein